MKILYFAWLRQMIGKSEEQLDLPVSIKTADDVIDYLISLGAPYEKAFEARDSIRIALDQNHVKGDAKINKAQEIAFFPPVTGG